MQQVLHREVGELQRCLEDDTGLSPTGTQLDLVVGLALEVKDDVHSTVVRVGLGTDVHLLGVEMARLGDFAHRAHEVLLGEQVTGAHTQLATYHLLIQAVITVDDHLVDAGLLALIHAHLQRDAVTLDFALNRDEVIEEVTVVEIEIGNGVIILLGTLVEKFLVIDVTLLDAQHLTQSGRRIDGIAHPGDIRDIVAFALADLEVNIHALLIKGHNAVAQDNGITVTFLVILVDNELLVGFIIAHDELLLREDFPQALLLIGLLHGALDLVVAQYLVAVNIDFVDLDFLVLVHVDVDDDLVLFAQVGNLDNFTCSLTESLRSIILLNDEFDAVGDIGRHLATSL